MRVVYGVVDLWCAGLAVIDMPCEHDTEICIFSTIKYPRSPPSNGALPYRASISQLFLFRVVQPPLQNFQQLGARAPFSSNQKLDSKLGVCVSMFMCKCVCASHYNRHWVSLLHKHKLCSAVHVQHLQKHRDALILTFARYSAPPFTSDCLVDSAPARTFDWRGVRININY